MKYFVLKFSPVWQHTFVSPSAFSRRVVVSYWRKYVHEVLVNRLGGLSLPRKSVVRLTDRPDMTLDVYRGRKTTRQRAKVFGIWQGWLLLLLFYVHGKHLMSCRDDCATRPGGKDDIISSYLCKVMTNVFQYYYSKQKSWKDNIKAWAGKYFASTNKTTENRTRWKGVVVM